MKCIDCGTITPRHISLCDKCRIRRYREKYPLKASYYALRSNAKRRGKVFELTFEQFCEFATRTDYMTKKGIFRDNYHIDRIDETKGYTIDNIQLLTNGENVRKFLKYHYDDHVGKMGFTVVTTKQKDRQDGKDDAPF